MNRVLLVGRLSKDVELKKTTSGTDIANFTVAIKKYGDGTDFINCVAFNKQAEFISNYAKSGNRVSVDGRLSTRSYERQDGTKVYVTEVLTDSVELLESKPKDDELPKIIPNLVKEDDLPF